MDAKPFKRALLKKIRTIEPSFRVYLNLDLNKLNSFMMVD